MDALCIDQADIPERGQQVSLMRDIYKNCKRDLVWMLAPSSAQPWDEKEITQGLRTMHEIHQNDPAKVKDLENPWSPWSDHGFPYNDKYRGFFTGNDSSRENDLSSLFRFDFDATRDLEAAFRRAEIWDRVWITQELSCSPNICLMAPGVELDWEIVSSFLNDVRYQNCIGTTVGGHEESNTSLWGYVFETARTIKYQQTISREAHPGTESSLMNTLVRFRCTHATDARDKIYGLLGLVFEPHDIVIDYRKTPHELFTETTLALINGSANIDIVSQNY